MLQLIWYRSICSLSQQLLVHYITLSFTTRILFINQADFFMFALLGLSLLMLSAATSSINQPVSLALTIYNDQFAMVKDTRSITLSKGRSDLYFTDVSAHIQPETVTFKALQETQHVKVFEQNFEANLVDTNSILKQYLNQNVEVFAKIGHDSVRINGVLLGYSSGYIIKTSQGIQVVNHIDGISFQKLPEGFYTLPTLHWKVYSPKEITTDCEVAYRTTGFSWKADYTIVLNQKEDQADVGGWVTIDNRSGKKYDHAKLKLIAGDVNIERKPVYFGTMARAEAMNKSPSFSEKSFSDFHLYTLNEPVTINDNSQKQVEFIPKVYGVAVRKYNIIPVSAGGYTQKHLKASNKIQFINSKHNKLGIPFPKGTVRVFKADSSDNSLEFIGESGIGHTPVDENITLITGHAFDITADKLASSYHSYQNSGYKADLNLTVTNHKDTACQIVVEIHNYRGDNVHFNWKTHGLDIDKQDSALIKIKRVFGPLEKFSYLWEEDYRR